MSKKKQATKTERQAEATPPIELSDDLLDGAVGGALTAPFAPASGPSAIDSQDPSGLGLEFEFGDMTTLKGSVWVTKKE